MFSILEKKQINKINFETNEFFWTFLFNKKIEFFKRLLIYSIIPLNPGDRVIYTNFTVFYHFPILTYVTINLSFPYYFTKQNNIARSSIHYIRILL